MKFWKVAFETDLPGVPNNILVDMAISPLDFIAIRMFMNGTNPLYYNYKFEDGFGMVYNKVTNLVYATYVIEEV